MTSDPALAESAVLDGYAHTRGARILVMYPAIALLIASS
jgi:hypothetical protein